MSDSAATVNFQEPHARGPCVVCGEATEQTARDERADLFYPLHFACAERVKKGGES